MSYSDHRRTLLGAIEQRAKCTAKYLQTQPVKLSIDGVIQWHGNVEIFRLEGHAEAHLAFGWWFVNKQSKTEYITVMGVPPLDTPLSAVKAFVASRRE